MKINFKYSLNVCGEANLEKIMCFPKHPNKMACHDLSDLVVSKLQCGGAEYKEYVYLTPFPCGGSCDCLQARL